MADDNKVIFGAEFDGEGVTSGIEDVLDSLGKAQEAQLLLKQSISETNDVMKANRKELAELQKQLKSTFDPKTVEIHTKRMEELNSQYDQLTKEKIKFQIAEKEVTKVINQYNKAVNESKKGNDELGKSFGKFLSVNKLVEDGVKKVSGQIKEAAFSIVTGFAGGIAATVIPTLTEYVVELITASHALTELEKNQRIVNDVFAQAARSAGDDIAKLDVYKKKLNDTNISAADRVKIAKEYNKTADETNKIDLQQIDNLELINQKIEAQNKLILQRAISTAALAKLTEASTKFVETQLLVDEAIQRTGLTEEKIMQKRAAIAGQQIQVNRNLQQSLDNYGRGVQRQTNQNVVLFNKEEKELLRLIDARDSAKDALNRLSALLNPLITPAGLTTPGGNTTQIENIFLQKLAELRARLAAAMNTGFQSESLIREQFSTQLDKEFLEIGKLIKEKRLTVAQGDILKGLLQQINEVELSRALEDFRTRVKDALKKIDDAIFAAQMEAANKRVANIRDEFDRDAKAIEQNYTAAVEAIQKRQNDFLKQIDAESKKGLITPEVARRKKFIATLVFGDLLNEAEFAKMNAQADLAFKTFQRNLEAAKLPFENDILGLSQEVTEEIRVQTAKFLEGQITYERYQKKITDILKKESRQRRDIQLEEAEEQLKLLEAQLKNTNLTQQQRDQLETQIRALKAQIEQLRRERLQGAAKDEADANKQRIDQLLSYVNAVMQVAQAVVQFWNQVNQAEQAALDRSIALQQKRVDNARELAEKGNAEFLEMEQKRLDELEAKREANARKQLAVNNALAASQAIVAAISAIAQAVQTGNPLLAIAAVASVIAAIGSVYQFANSLQSQSPSFFEGTEYVDGIAPAGKDKIKANLHKGERVVTADDNKSYWDTLSAIHNHTIPANVLNDFVNSYPHYQTPGIDLSKLMEATDGAIGADSAEVLRSLDKLNGTMGQVVTGLSEMGIQFNLDEHGFEASISKASKRRRLRNNS